MLAALGAAGTHPVGPSIAYYSPAPGEAEDALLVQATFPVAADAVDGLDTVTIPAADVASLIHRGEMAAIDETYQQLNAWVRDQGFTATGHAREIYLEMSEHEADWVVEVQLDFTR